MILEPAAVRRRHNDHWVGVPYTHLVNHRRHRICPWCLHQHRYIQLAWHFTLFTCCPIHGIRLVERCGHCGRAFDWRRSAPEFYECGARLKSGMSAFPDARGVAVRGTPIGLRATRLGISRCRAGTVAKRLDAAGLGPGQAPQPLISCARCYALLRGHMSGNGLVARRTV